MKQRPIKVTPREFLKRYFGTWNLNAKANLTPKEIKVLIEIMFFNYNKSAQSMIKSPFYKEGRKVMLEKLNIDQSQYTRALKKLTEVGFLVNTNSEQKFALAPNIAKLYTAVHQEQYMPIYYPYEIVVPIYDQERSTVSENS